MSGDETDVPSRQKKTLRRVALPWIDSTISDLFEAVDSYEEAVGDECLLPIAGKLLPSLVLIYHGAVAGNRPLPRSYHPAATDKQYKAIPKLPRNWYDNDWYQTRLPGFRSLLDVGPPIPIPNLVCPI
jgi:hypothetical protein